MTSSLVGSEMCIRDSWRIGCNSKTRTKEGAGGKRSSGLLLVLTIIDPVSYTHLTLPTICSV
eukprot:4552724-Prorocentrum_lima.AAC.1